MAMTSVCAPDDKLVAAQNTTRADTTKYRKQSPGSQSEPARRSQAQSVPESLSGLGAIEAVVSVIEHEVNQPLHAIVNFADASIYVLEETPGVSHPNLLGWLKQIAEQANRAAQIIRQAGCLVENTPRIRSVVDINKLVRDCLDLVKVDLESHQVKVRCELGGMLPHVAADAVQILLVLVNLLRNALNAVSQHAAGNRELLIRTAVIADEVQVSMHDCGYIPGPQNGHNMLESLLDTAAAASSLNLALTRSMVQSHDGCIWAQSNADRGATLFLSLPALKEQTNDV